MSDKVSQTVRARVKALYSIMATVAAQKAVDAVKWDNEPNAENWAKYTEKWLIKAGADAARWQYRAPSIK
jgi:hypothetical protein